ncbi:biogenesis of lysosome-related organelles complex 1 subunit 6 [Lucilia sericata]|uniref:biogenesis of lysosome-related organelles complex 1 subunit 6 n=1 Tax=Lucilia sericata TaxID=13632 RepID=UPI0018A81A90|nr:biogenesis of lysosome-related organelles complex 1 subunit 6 [Lucilia sericata]
MLKSNNFKSIADDLTAFSTTENVEQLRRSSLEQTTNTILQDQPSLNNNNIKQSNVKAAIANNDNSQTEATTSLAALQLSAGVLQSYAPPIAKARGQLKELIQKQNKIYIDLSAEKFKLDNAEVAKLQDMMINVKVCREKLLKIKKHMQNIYQRTKVLKKRAINIQTCKEKELQRKLQKQQQEESLIGKINQ